MEQVKRNFNEAKEVLDSFCSEENSWKNIEAAGNLLVEAFKDGNKVISCGNGGSMCDAMHFAEELSGRFRDDRRALPAIAVSDASHLTCTANDYGFEYVFSRFIEGLGNKGDVLLAISTSGNSENVINGIAAAKKKGMQIIGLTGSDGGRMTDLCDVEIRVEHSGYADRIQEIHIKIIHSLIHFVELNYL